MASKAYFSAAKLDDAYFYTESLRKDHDSGLS
jgi:hypothetical protein